MAKQWLVCMNCKKDFLTTRKKIYCSSVCAYINSSNFQHEPKPLIDLMTNFLTKKQSFIRIAHENNLKRPIVTKNITKVVGIVSGSRDRYRELVRIRDNRTCQACGKIWKKGERRFDIHHINGTPEDTRKADKNWNNLITLCHKCHLQIEGYKMTRQYKDLFKLKTA